MVNTEKKVKHRKKNSSISRAMMLILFVVIVLFIVLVVSDLSLQKKISVNDNRIENLRQLIKEEEERTQDIEELKDYIESDEYLEQTAKDKLGFVKDGEIIFKESE